MMTPSWRSFSPRSLRSCSDRAWTAVAMRCSYLAFPRRDRLVLSCGSPSSLPDGRSTVPAAASTKPPAPVSGQRLYANFRDFTLAFICGGHHRSLIIHLDFGIRPQCPNHFVAAGDYLVAILEAGEYFNVSSAGDASVHFLENGLLALDHKDSLHLFFSGLDSRGIGIHRKGRARLLHFQVALLPNRQRLNGDRQGTRTRRRGDLGSAGKAGPYQVLRNVKSDHDLEIFGFLARRGALRGGESRGANNSRVADFNHIALERSVRDGVNGHLRGLIQLHVDNIGFVHLYFGGDDGHVGNGHDR